MSLNFSIDIFTGIVTGIGIFCAYSGLRSQLNVQNKQLKIQIFADYTKRYQEIIAKFPENINDQRFDLPQLKEDRDFLLRNMRQYFDLCFEEWYLDSRELLDEEFWELWKSGIITALSKPAFIDSWKIIKLSSCFGNSFEKFIDEKIKLVNVKNI